MQYTPLLFKRPVIYVLMLGLFLSLPAQAQEEEPVSLFQPLLDSGLIEPLEIEQTIGDATVTLHWAYADEQQLAVSYSVTGIEVEETDPADPEAYFYFPQAKLTHRGNEFSYSGGWVEADPAADSLTMEVSYYSQVMRPGDTPQQAQIDNDYFANEFAEMPATLDLQLAINLEWRSPNMGLSPDPDKSINGFVLDFTIPFYPAVNIAVNQTVSAAGIEVTLGSVAYTPSQAALDVCYTLPDEADWRPAQDFTVFSAEGGEPLLFAGMGLQQLPLTGDTSRCQDMRFLGGIPTEAETLTLLIEKMEVSEPEGGPFWEAVQQQLALENIVIELNVPNTPFHLISYPDDMTEQAVYERIIQVRDEQRERLTGPWEFTIKL